MYCQYGEPGLEAEKVILELYEDWKKNNLHSRYNFEAVISGSNYRTKYSTLLNRLDIRLSSII